MFGTPCFFKLKKLSFVIIDLFPNHSLSLTQILNQLSTLTQLNSIQVNSDQFKSIRVNSNQFSSNRVKSVSQSINQSIKQPINQTANQSNNQWVRQQFSQSANHLYNGCISLETRLCVSMFCCTQACRYCENCKMNASKVLLLGSFEENSAERSRQLARLFPSQLLTQESVVGFHHLSPNHSSRPAQEGNGKSRASKLDQIGTLLILLICKSHGETCPC
jgi:hypothetical protein